VPLRITKVPWHVAGNARLAVCLRLACPAAPAISLPHCHCESICGALPRLANAAAEAGLTRTTSFGESRFWCAGRDAAAERRLVNVLASSDRFRSPSRRCRDGRRPRAGWPPAWRHRTTLASSPATRRGGRHSRLRTACRIPGLCGLVPARR